MNRSAVQLSWLLFCLLLGATSAYGEVKDNVAPDFSAHSLDGKAITLSESLKNGPVYLVFWATWCSNCMAETPRLKELHHHFNDRMPIYAINSGMGDSREEVEAYVKKHQLPYRVIFDKEGTISKDYGVFAVPIQYIISKSGEVIYKDSDVPSAEGMSAAEIIEQNWGSLVQ